MTKTKRQKSRIDRSVPPNGTRRPRRTLFRLKRYLPLTLILVGLMVILAALFMRVYSNHRQKQLVQKYENAIEEPVPTNVTGGQPSEDLTAQVQRETVQSNVPEEDIRLLGVLTIPKIDLTVAIGEGTDNNTLKYAVGHFNETALPGEEGNSCIAGHRNYTWGKFFNRLDEIETGDEILVERDGTQYSYTVTDTLIVNPEDLWVLDQTEDAQITLITCTPMYSATQRLIIRGTLSIE